jgi:hypothetical protein
MFAKPWSEHCLVTLFIIIGLLDPTLHPNYIQTSISTQSDCDHSRQSDMHIYQDTTHSIMIRFIEKRMRLDGIDIIYIVS